jgi:2-polyprenyl-3-methyl-5-hydroxy-6-metoxy-1,4-benzoquinol methylase
MAWLTQTRFPLAWNCFQWTIGGTADKRRLCLKYYGGQKRVLEVGCSAGNIAVAFLDRPGVRYVGVDIDRSAIALAKKRFARFHNFSFRCEDLAELVKSGDRFDYVLLAGVLHHLADRECGSLLHAAAELLDEAGLLAVVDPVLPEPGDSRFLRLYLRTLEQGRHVRDRKALAKLLNSERGLVSCGSETCLVGATPVGLPKCARFGVWQFRKRIGLLS